MTTRAQMWESLGDDVDVFVIGGGINGAGIARDAAQRGLKVAVVEMGDVASGTSSRSSKLVHGGVRYLEMLEFGLVFESVSERRILLDLAPHLVNPLGFLFPVYKQSRRSLAAISTGLWLYEGLALFRSPKRPRKLKPAAVAIEEPLLNRVDLTGAPLYYDCATDDARLTLENAVAAVHDGATFVTYAKATGFDFDDDGRITAVHVEDLLDGDTKTIRAKAVVNATGPWTEKTVGLNPLLADADILRPTKGVHIVVKQEVLPVKHAVVCFHPIDTRVLFALPWGDCTYLGTTDTDYSGDPADAVATGEDIDYLIAAAAAYFPDSPITYDDIHCTWAGLRPLMRPPESRGGVKASAVSREHFLDVGTDGVITIAGGKLTTYRRMCEEVVDTVVKLLKLQSQLPDDVLRKGITDASLLPGALGWPADDDAHMVAAQVAEAAKGLIDGDTALLLVNSYGMRAFEIAERVVADPSQAERILAHRPEIMAQVDFGVEQELASTVLDVLKQRTQIFYRDAQQGRTAVPKVAARMATLLGWSDERRAKMEAHYLADVEQNERWREEVSVPK